MNPVKYALRRLPKWLAWAACAVAGFGWWWSHRQFTRFQAETAHRAETQLHDARFLMPDFDQALDPAISVVIREGMPRDFNAAIDPETVPREELREEYSPLAINDSERHGYHFRETIRHVAPEDRALLRALLLEVGSMTPWIGPKLCGGFHPNWSLECYSEKFTQPILEIQFCFGCEEVRVYNGRFNYVADLPPEFSKQFRWLLSKYPGEPKASR